MPENNNNAADRQKKIEAFLLDPEKTIFETITQFEGAVTTLTDILSRVDLDTLDKLQGADGKTPVRGVDYFNEEDIQAFQDFILSKIPTIGVDLPSVQQVEDFVRNEVAKIPRIKGDKGDSIKGDPGKDGSPDSGADIVKKLRALGKNQMLNIGDIRGLENVLTRKVSDEDFAALAKRVDEFKIVIPANPGTGGEGTGVDATAIHFDGVDEFDTIAEDATPAAGDYFLAERASDGVKIKVPFSALAGDGTGDMLAATYDPTNVAGDAFDMANMVEAADAKVLTAAERTKLGHISVTQAVDLDTIESNSNASKTKTDHITVTQAVDLDAIETRVNALDAAVILKGTWDASAGTFPGSGSAQAGESWIVSVTGTVDGQTFTAGDRIIAILDNASTGTFASNWFKADYTDLFTTTTLGDLINSASAKTTPVDADMFALMDSAASNVAKKLSWLNIKATLKTYFDTLYQPLLATLTSWGAITRASGFDTFVATPSSANLRGLLTDKTGSGAAVFATSPSITTATLNGTQLLAEGASIGLDPAGSADGAYSGITMTATAGYSQAFGDLVYLAVADGRWELADADALATAGNVALAMVVVAGTDGNACTLLLMGRIRADAKFPTMTVGATQYVGETAGAIQGAIPTGADNVIRTVGYAMTADELYFNPSTDWSTTVA